MIRRSVLIVPANVERFWSRAHERGADAIMLDLEDSTPPGEKAAARGALERAIPTAGKSGADVIVRINHFEPADVAAALQPGLNAIALPKADVESVRELDRLLAGSNVGIAVSIESAVAMGQLDAILGASSRVVTADLGVEDLALDLGIEPTDTGEELATARQLLVLAARRAEVAALGLTSTLADYTNLAALGASARRAYAMGFVGASCIHPAQVPALNEAFSPSREQLEHAERVLAAYETALAHGRASTALDGRMIDVPVAERARRLLARARAIAQSHP